MTVRWKNYLSINLKKYASSYVCLYFYFFKFCIQFISDYFWTWNASLSQNWQVQIIIFFILIKLFHVVFRSIINNIYLQKHFKTGSCDVPEGPKGMNLQNYLPCIFLLTWIKNLYKINLSYNELLLSLDIWQLSSNFRTFKILQAISWP